MLYSISRDCKYSNHLYVYSRTTCGQEIKYLSIYLSCLLILIAFSVLMTGRSVGPESISNFSPIIIKVYNLL